MKGKKIVKRVATRKEPMQTVSLYLDTSTVRELEEIRASGLLGDTLDEVVAHALRESMLRDWKEERALRRYLEAKAKAFAAPEAVTPRAYVAKRIRSRPRKDEPVTEAVLKRAIRRGKVAAKVRRK